MLAANHAVLADPVFGLPADAVAGLHATLGAWLRDNTPLLAARAAAFLVEGHGDLRPEHVCLESPPVVFDCLEFNRDFRIVDIADELAALAMECERLGASFVGAVLFQVYTARTGDVPAPALRHFYQSYRAALRARLALLHTRELPPSAWARWQATAQEYLAVAQQHAAALRPSTFQ
jgi:aminoglycoside phosphotransferase family enzyme